MCRLSDEGHSHRVIQVGVPGMFRFRARKGSHCFTPLRRMHAMASTDPFSASVIPFEVPEQMRAFAEKGVSQVRDSYAKFKDAAETHNGTIEAVFTTANKGASEYSAKLLEFFKANTSASLDFAQEVLGVKTPSAALELWTSHTRKQFVTLAAQAIEPADLGRKGATQTFSPIQAS